jgi:hypothetical protein
MMVVNKGSHTSFFTNTHVRNCYFLLIFFHIYHQVVFRTTLNKACALFVSILACIFLDKTSSYFGFFLLFMN